MGQRIFCQERLTASASLEQHTANDSTPVRAQPWMSHAKSPVLAVYQLLSLARGDGPRLVTWHRVCWLYHLRLSVLIRLTPQLVGFSSEPEKCRPI
jgi:hypothetical protein